MGLHLGLTDTPVLASIVNAKPVQDTRDEPGYNYHYDWLNGPAVGHNWWASGAGLVNPGQTEGACFSSN